MSISRYFETHLSIKASIAKEMLKITHRAPSQPSNSSKVSRKYSKVDNYWYFHICLIIIQTIDNDREAVLKNLDLLITSTAKLPSHFFTNWAPIQLFMKLDGAKLILKVSVFFIRLILYRRQLIQFCLNYISNYITGSSDLSMIGHDMFYRM